MSTSTSKSVRSQPSFLDATNAEANADGSPKILRFGDGLMLYAQASGVKTWKVKVQRNGRQTTLAIGHFPAMKINQAKAERMKLRVAADPVREKRDEKTRVEVARANTFREVAGRWIVARAAKAHWEDETRKAYEARLVNDVFPKIGDRPIAEITLDDVMSLISAIQAKRPALAVSIKQIMSKVFDFAIRWQLASMNPVAIIAEDLPVREGEKSHAHMATIEDARRALAAVERRSGSLTPSVLLAHRLMALTGCRKMEIVDARWSEVDLDAGWWTIPAERMKGKFGKRRAHSVALSPQAIEVLVTAKRFAKSSDFVFPSEVSGVGRIDRSTINDVMARCHAVEGIKMPPHGWRSTFSTIMNERDETRFRVIDVMLAHATFRDSVEAKDGRKKSVEGHYNRATFKSQRHAIASEWADLLLDGAPTASALVGLGGDAPASNVVELRKVA